MSHVSTYEVIYGSTKDSTAVGELTPSTLSYSHSLNEAGSCSLRIPLEALSGPSLTNEPAAQELTAANFAADGRTSVYVLRDGVFVWSGILWGISADVGAGSASLSCSGFLSYYHRRHVLASTSYSAADQASVIAKGLVDGASGIGMDTTSVTASGVNRTRTYPAHDAVVVGEALQNLTEVSDGIDFWFGAEWGASKSITKKFYTGYPNTGRDIGTTLDINSNVSDLSVTIDGSAVTTKAITDGEPESTRQTDTNTTLEVTLPRLESYESHSSVSEDATLLAHAEKMLERGGQANKVLSVELYPGARPAVGSYRPGDIIEVRGSRGWLDVSGDYRITGYRVNVNSSGTEQVSIDMASQEAWL